MASRYWEDESAEMAAQRSRETAMSRFWTKSTKDTLADDLANFADQQGISYRDALMYADQYYKGNRTDSLVVLDRVLNNTASLWMKTLGRVTRTINRPDRMVLQYHPFGTQSVETSKSLPAALKKLSVRILEGHEGAGFRAIRTFYDETYLLTNFCIMCGRNSGMGVNPAHMESSIGLLWYESHLPTVLAAIRAALGAGGMVQPEYLDSTAAVTGICHRCKYKCHRCAGQVSLIFDVIETMTMQQEGVCRKCAKQNLALIEAPKFGRRELRQLNRNLIQLKGGTAE